MKHSLNYLDLQALDMRRDRIDAVLFCVGGVAVFVLLAVIAYAR